MAESRPALKAAFPTPPPFFKHFTAENVATAKAQLAQNDSLTRPDAATALQYLTPPPPPSDGKYKSFGHAHDLNQPELSLADGGVEQLYPSDDSATTDPTPQLLSLSRSVLLNFLELVGILSVDPSRHAEKIEHLQTIFFNMHHLINLYRPHQARESLILMMEEQIKRHRLEIASMREAAADVAGMLKTIKMADTSGAGPSAGLELTEPRHMASNDRQKQTELQAQSRLWSALELELS